FAPFEIEDESGRAAVSPVDAIIEGIEAVARQHVEDGNESVMQAALGSVNKNTDRTLGFRYKEMHLPLDVEVYVLGVVGENRCIGAPPAGAKGQRFLISVNSEEARAAELGTKSKWMLGLGVACLIGAVACLGSAFWLAQTGFSVEGPRDILQGASWW
ncbi:MAG TPA: GIDE domain-containing protein, partial [Methyloceanibacter sp.]|nr:GIDE domain-containing protein [Methyloceanibacter sp.]